MQITVLGAGSAYPRAGGACAGFLVRAGNAKIWLDAGNGTFSRLQRYVSYRELDALILTHGHADHVADVLPLMYALGFDPEVEPSTLVVYAPSDVEPTLKWPLGGTSKDMFKRIFAFRSIAEPFEIGPVSFEPFRTQHPAETYGLRMTEGSSVAVYTSDTALYDGLADACRDADLLIAEATYVNGVEAPPGVHMWARETGWLAREAGAKQLVLTHIWPTFAPARAVAEAAREFDGPVEAAAEDTTYDV
jgi:ribonuclease BN (tRNA processing enzyme)